jgi:hypothetical protein
MFVYITVLISVVAAFAAYYVLQPVTIKFRIEPVIVDYQAEDVFTFVKSPEHLVDICYAV